MQYEQIKDYVNALYEHTETARISIEGRQKLNIYDDHNYIYGDCNLSSMYEIITTAAPNFPGNFYDLGSGGGRALLFTALCFPFTKCIGVELIADLANISQQKLEQIKQEINNQALPASKQINVEIKNADFTQVALEDASMVYSHATCFDKELMQRLTTTLENQLKPGAKVALVTQSLNSTQFNLIFTEQFAMDWGLATVRIYEKI